ncbi:beta-1,3-galactosyltransferase 5-like [Physella acuta]|uniref:beta-1,3-galactosyltransferase 5-like n=1 Tax=Physella acuta TaxID=109671 RepID=UPI0027DB8730|nr:beta-1,3-galactosyltransferase 5-like [Physella acuta]
MPESKGENYGIFPQTLKVIQARRWASLLILMVCLLLVSAAFLQFSRWPDVQQTWPKQRPGQRTSACPGCFVAEFDVSVDIPALCMNSDVTLVIVIHVQAKNFVARSVIRHTWLASVRDVGDKVRYFFLLGQPENDDVRQDVLNESELHKDIVLYEFVDSYRNLTLKTVLAMQWITSRCPNARYFFKTDDDVWVNLTNLLTAINSNKKVLEYSLGGVCRSVPVVRDTSSKWHATKAEFPKDVYDPYCSGTGYVGGAAVAQGVAHVYTQVPYFHLEDVFVGMCLKVLGYSTTRLLHFDNTQGAFARRMRSQTERLTSQFIKSPTKKMIEIYRKDCSK